METVLTSTSTTETLSRAHRMAGHFGLMVHWIYPTVLPENGPRQLSLDEAVDAFDVPRFLSEFEASGAQWLIWTFGQNTGYYCSPNSVLDQLAGAGHASARDLSLEIARGVKALGRRFIGYLPAEMAFNDALRNAFEWRDENGPVQAPFQEHYCRFLEEYSLRFGGLLDGWWIDGAWMFNAQMLDWPRWAGALRAGNPDAVLTFNNGGFTGTDTRPMHEECDYLPGETDVLINGKIRVGRGKERVLMLPDARLAPDSGCRWHALVPIDCPWGFGFDAAPEELVPDTPFTSPDAGNPQMAAPVYSDADLRCFVKYCTRIGGAVTLNVGIYREGHLSPQTLAQVRRITA